ncbi:MAG: zf-HC2 domain-containing protein, partial [Gemmatimonadetes bacterium]|nr:zf-HC2 domain-containing protein [Gemmatimonadota bacterium]
MTDRCHEIRDLLSAFHDGELSDADAARVREHLPGCDECRGIVAEFAA